MSDILLSVGLQTGATETSQLQSDLQKIISRIDKNPPKVKVGLQVDQSAINHFKSQLTQIVNSVGLSSGSPITVNISGIGEITAQAGKAKSALDGVAKAGKQAADAVNKMGASQVQTALTQINIQLKTIQTNYAKWTAAANGQSKDFYSTYGQQIQTLETLRQKVEANEISWSQFREELASIKQVASEAATAINKFGEDHTAKKITVLSRNTEEYRDAISKCNKELSNLKKNQEQWTAAKNGRGSSDYAALGQYEQQLEDLITDLNTGTMTMDKFQSRFGAIKSAADNSRSAIRGFGEDTRTVGDRLKGLAEKFGIWLSVSQVIMQAVRAIKQMVSAVRDVDAAMTELRKVTDETDAVYDRFLSNASSRAKDVGAAISDIVSATADFARLGYSIEDASALADIAIMYKNIGDGVEDVNQATESIVSTMQAFGMMPEEAMHIVDVFNAIGNNFAISSGGIGDALQRSAAAMNAAGNTLEETAALVAAANTVVQNPDSVGTTLKTVSMFLRASKVEAEEAGESTEGMANSVSELRDKLLALTEDRVDILTDSGKYKGTYEILRDIAAVWDDIVSNQGTDSAAILELIGGKRNANVVAAILENFQIAEDALRVAMESAGSAAIENEKHLDSINGKIEIFKAAFQELSVNLISSDFVKGIIDFGTGLIGVMTSVANLVSSLGGLKTVLLAVCTTMLIAKGGLIALKVQMIATAVVTKLVAAFNAVKNGIANIIQIIPNAVTAWRAYAAGTVSASTAMQASIPIIGLVLAAVTMLIGGLSLYNSKAEETRREAISSAESAAELSNEISSLAVEYFALSEAVKTDEGAKESLISTQDALIERLGLEQYEIDQLIDQYGNLSDAIEQASIDALTDKERDLRGGINAHTEELIEAAKAYSIANKSMNHIIIGWTKESAEINHAAMNALVNAGYVSSGAFSSLGSEFYLPTDGFELDSIEGITAAHQRLGDMLDVVQAKAGSNNEVYDALYYEYNRVTSALNNYQDAIGSLNSNLAQQYMLQGLIGKEVPANKEGFNQYRQSVIDAAIASGEFVGSAEQIASAVDSVLRKESSFAGFYTDIVGDAASDLGAESDVVADKLETLKTKLLELTAAYSEWKAAQSGPESGDIYDDSKQALQQILDGLETGKIGTDKYKASVEFLVPEANRSDVAAYVESLKRYITEDASGISNFISDAITSGLMVDDGSGNISIVSDATVQDFCNKLTITPDMAQAIFGELEEYGWDMQWSVDDFIDPEVDTEQTESDLQTVQQGVDGISESVDTLNAKTIGDLGASETVVSLLEVIKWMNDIDNKKISDKHVNVYTHEIPADGESSANGTSSAEGGRTLVGELGAELVVSDDRYYLVGQNGAEFVNLKHGDMVFNHVDTQKILEGRSGVRGQALRYGAVGVGGLSDKALFTGGITVKVDISGGGQDPSSEDGSGSGGSGGSGASRGSSSPSKKDEGPWFERQYKDHQHWLEMDKESTEDYLKWLDGAYKQAYEEGVIDIDEYYKYQEEVYKGYQDLFKDYLNDIDHEVSLLEGAAGNSDEIIDLVSKAMDEIEKELASSRAAGLDENGDYIQYLEQQWSEYSQTVIDMREQAEAESESTIDDLVEYRIDMLKQEIKDHKDALSEQLDDLQDFYDKQRKMLQDQYDEEKYLEEQKEKRKSVTDIRADLAMLENDDSAWAQKRKLELQAELADAEKELNSFEKDHALDMTLDMLDEQQAAQEAQIQAQMDALDKKLNDPHALFNQALEDIKNNTAELYQQFIEYNRKHGSGNDQDIADMWEEAYIADLEYQDTHDGQHNDGIKIGNYTGYVVPEISTPPVPEPKPEPDSQPHPEPNPDKLYPYGKVSDTGGNIGVGSSGTQVKAIQYALNELGFGNSGTQGCDGQFGSGTKSAVKAFQRAMGISADGIVGENTRAQFRIQGYATGTDNATPGWHELFEGNVDEYVFTSSDGNRYKMFSGLGDKVLNGKATDFLYDFATTGGGVLTKMIADLFGISNFGNIAKPVQAIEIHSGDIIVQGNANERTVSEIRRAQRENLKFVITEFNKLNK